jgi:ABC-type uncharacterized transport system substrate-binding protein
VWITARAEVVMSDGYLDKLKVEWTFDELFTNLLLLDYDRNADHQLSPREGAAIKAGYFDNLASSGYFSHLSLGKTVIPVSTVTEFEVVVNSKGQAVYRFTIPLGQRVDAKTPFRFGLYDETFFTDMVFDKSQPVKVTQTGNGKSALQIAPDKSEAFYGGQVVPVYATVTWGQL